MLTAEMLLKDKFFAGTVNRAYYSCLQYVLHVLLEKLGHTREDLEKIPRDGTHNKAQYLLELSLVGKDKGAYKWIQQKLPEFKKERVIADYFGDPLDADRGQTAINMANAIMTTLRTHYK